MTEASVENARGFSEKEDSVKIDKKLIKAQLNGGDLLASANIVDSEVALAGNNRVLKQGSVILLLAELVYFLFSLFLLIIYTICTYCINQLLFDLVGDHGNHNARAVREVDSKYILLDNTTYLPLPHVLLVVSLGEGLHFDHLEHKLLTFGCGSLFRNDDIAKSILGEASDVLQLGGHLAFSRCRALLLDILVHHGSVFAVTPCAIADFL